MTQLPSSIEDEGMRTYKASRVARLALDDLAKMLESDFTAKEGRKESEEGKDLRAKQIDHWQLAKRALLQLQAAGSEDMLLTNFAHIMRHLLGAKDSLGRLGVLDG